ncbi:MAG: TRAP transporter TatT component family protein [Acidobacteria bacterium]|jgi:predicted anti-sigma-YlaC factor YlaD|nr:TRAP transporter TatT component family protein [Acidobacteriota bacterium]
MQGSGRVVNFAGHPAARPGAAPAALALLLAAIAGPACSVQKLAADQLGSALASGTSVYATDDDPELVGDALPFALKTMESLLAVSPENTDLLLSAASGFTQYSYAYLQSEADYVEAADLAQASELRGRATRMYRRALGYGLRGLDARHPGFSAALRRDPAAALAKTTAADVPLLYWTGAAWAAAIASAKNDADLAADLPTVEAIMTRARALDPDWGDGAIHDFFISWEGGRPAAGGGSPARAREAFDRAVAASGGRRAAPFVSYAETVAVASQNRPEFVRLLETALAIDPDAVPAQRLANLIAQKRARWLLARQDELFIE